MGGATSTYCFVAGTAVLTVGGAVPIETVQAGDLVWAWDEETGNTSLKKVVETYENETTELVHISVDNEVITATPGHPFYAVQKGWIKAIDLRAGDMLVLVNGEYVIVEWIQHEILEAPIKVFNFQVADYHTYFVTNDGILVHNACGDTGAYKELRTVEKGSGNEVYHIVEKRLINATKFSSANDMPSISLTKETHRQFTNAWRRALPYGKSYSPVEVLNAAKDVYADYPQLLKIAEGMIK